MHNLMEEFSLEIMIANDELIDNPEDEITPGETFVNFFPRMWEGKEQLCCAANDINDKEEVPYLLSASKRQFVAHAILDIHSLGRGEPSKNALNSNIKYSFGHLNMHLILLHLTYQLSIDEDKMWNIGE